MDAELVEGGFVIVIREGRETGLGVNRDSERNQGADGNRRDRHLHGGEVCNITSHEKETMIECCAECALFRWNEVLLIGRSDAARKASSSVDRTTMRWTPECLSAWRSRVADVGGLRNRS